MMSFFKRSMKFINKFRYLFITLAIAGGLGFYQVSDGEHQKDKVIMNLIYRVLESTHFAPQTIDNDFSAEVYQNFLNDIDYNKRFLLQEDVAALSVHENKIDDQIKQSKLDFFEQSYELYQQRLLQAKTYYEAILAEPFNYELDEEYQTDPEKVDYAASTDQLRERWRKYLKYRTVLRLEEKLHNQEQALAKSDTLEEKSFEELEEKAREKVREVHEQWFSNLQDMERIDWVGAYMNSITQLYDPHTQYFPPERKEDFEINMTGQLEGIGAQLQQEGDYIKVSKIITGSACWKQGDLEVGDRILKVAQGEDGPEVEPVDLVGMKVRKAVNYIRGPKGTTVILTVQKVDGTKQRIEIVRDLVELESTFAKSSVLGEGENKIGYIRLPKFYVNFYGDENHDCAEDVKAELEKLKKENVNGVILDLRNNGGGTLQGVVDIVGLFIEEGPVVQVKTSGGRRKVLKDTDDDVVYDGPLVVMVNRFSASATEIFAAAIQDYNRGVIVGDAETFGKGTVQNMLDMDRAVSMSYDDVKPLGALKLTIQKYYRINGGTPQLRGVNPDIVLPDNFMHIPYGEKEQDHALPYDEIEAADYETWPRAVENLKPIRQASAERVSANEKFALIKDYADWIRDQREDDLVNLNLQKYQAQQEEYRAQAKLYKNIRKSDEKLTVTANQDDLEKIEASEENRERNQKWFENISEDLILQEAYAISLDLREYYPQELAAD